MKELYPFVAASILYLVSPILSAQARAAVSRWVSEARRYSPVADKAVPDYLAPRSIDDYIDFAADLAQVVPAIVLTGIGVTLALPADDVFLSVTAQLVTVVAIVVVQGYVMTQSPQAYAARKVYGYSVVILACLGVNVIAALTVALVTLR